MPTEPVPVKRPSELEKNVIGKSAKGGELKKKTTDLVEDICYIAAGQDVADLHNMTVEDEFAGKVFPRAEYRGQVRNLREGNADWVNVDHPDQSNGLTHAQRATLFEIYGENALTPPDEKPEWRKFLDQFTGFFSLLLIVGGLLCMIAYGADPEGTENLFLGMVLFIVVTITAIFTYQQESASADMMKKFQKIGATKQNVTIEGQTKTIEVTEMVPGDVFRLNNEVRPPCDCRILSASNDFAVIEASLTGEPDAIKKGPKTSPKPDERALNQKNIVVAGTEIAAGEAWCMSIATGDQTVMGRNFALMLDTKALKEDTPIRKEIDRFVEIISAIAICLGVVFLIINVVVVGVSVEAIVFTIGIIVANVPEGLLATVTVSLALTAARMKDVMVLVKNLEAVETLGSTSVICSDKTGTLTQNKMTVVHSWTASYDSDLGAKQVGQYWDTGPVPQPSCPFPGVEEKRMVDTEPYYLNNYLCNSLVQIAGLCSTAKWILEDKIDRRTGKVMVKFADLPIQERSASGDASEIGFIKFSEARCGGKEGGVNGLRQRYPEAMGGVIPFDSKNKWMVKSHVMADEDGKKFTRCFVKGGVDKVWGFINKVAAMDEGKNVVYRPKAEFEDSFRQVLALMASQGLRLFCFGYWDLPEDTDTSLLGMGMDTVGSWRNMLKLPEGTDDWADDIRQPNYCRANGPYTKETDANGLRNNGLIFAGILALQDPPRMGVPEAVKTCHEASIHVVMVTGDHPQTAAAIAKGIGILWGKTMEEMVTDRCLVGRKGLDAARQSVDDANNGASQPPGLSAVKLAELMKDSERKPDFSKEFEKEVEAQIKKEEDARARLGFERQILSRAVSGDQLKKYDQERYTKDWYEAFEYVLQVGRQGLVFARTSPIQKLHIVNHFRMANTYIADEDESQQSPFNDPEPGKRQVLVKDEMVTAVTGDGVNDAPALSNARIGICMGIAGTDVTKEAADMILMDDNFASIVNGVKEGRLIFDNLKKSIAYTLSSNIPEITPFVSFIIVGLPSPLSTVLILCVDLGTDMVPAISLAYENPEKDIMKRKPRSADDNLVTTRLISFSYFQIGVIQALAGFFSFFSVMYAEGYAPEDLPGSGELAGYFTPGGPPFGGFSVQENLKAQSMAQTAFFTAIVIVQWSDILICKTRRLSLFDQGMKNDQLNFGLFFETALACFLIYVPGVSVIFGMQKLRFVYWLPAIPFSILIFTYDETRKWIIRHHDDVLDFFRFQKEKGLMRNDYNESLYWEGYEQEGAAKEWPIDEDWTEEEKADHKTKTQSLSKASKRIEKAARWLDRFSYW